MPTQSFSKHTLKYSEFLQAIHIWALRIPGHAAVQKQNCNLNSSVLQEIPSQAILFSLQYPLSYLLKLFCYSFLFSSQEIFYSVVLSLLFYCHCSFKNAATEKKKNLSSLRSFLNAFSTWLGVSYEKEVKNCCIIDKDELYSSWLYFKLQVYHRSLILLI